MTNVQAYHEGLMLMLVRLESELISDIDHIKSQLTDPLYWNANDRHWRFSARKAKADKNSKLRLIQYAIKKQKTAVNISKVFSAKLLAKQKKEERIKSHSSKVKPKNRLLVTGGQLISMAEAEETVRILRRKLKSLMDFEEYVLFCKENIEPMQLEVRERVRIELNNTPADGDRGSE